MLLNAWVHPCKLPAGFILTMSPACCQAHLVHATDPALLLLPAPGVAGGPTAQQQPICKSTYCRLPSSHEYSLGHNTCAPVLADTHKAMLCVPWHTPSPLLYAGESLTSVLTHPLTALAGGTGSGESRQKWGGTHQRLPQKPHWYVPYSLHLCSAPNIRFLPHSWQLYWPSSPFCRSAETFPSSGSSASYHWKNRQGMRFSLNPLQPQNL